jgi:hypothetical protein
MDLSK